MRPLVLVFSLVLPGLTIAAPPALTKAAPLTLSKYVFESATVTDLGTLGGSTSRAYDINESGTIAGMAFDATQKPHAVAWVSGTIKDLHIGSSVAWAEAAAYGISDTGYVVGDLINIGYNHWRAFRAYVPGIPVTTFSKYYPTGGLPFDWNNHAYAVSTSLYIAGSADRIPNPEHPPPPDTADLCFESLPVQFVLAGPDLLPLFCIADVGGDNIYNGEGIPPAARDVNESGNFVGTDGDTSTYSMFLFKDGVRISVPAPAGLADPLIDGRAEGLNDKNWVVGTYGEPGLNVRAFVWDGVAANSTSLGTLPGGTRSWADDINEQYMVAGASQRGYGSSASPIRRNAGYLWHLDFGMKQLPALSSFLTYSGGLFYFVPEHCAAHGLNDRKANSGLVQVVGECNVNGIAHAVRWDVAVRSQQIILPPPGW